MKFFRQLWRWEFFGVLAVGGASGEASAQRVSIAFSALGVEPVPISPGAMGLLSVVLLFVAWWSLRQGAPGRHWPLLLLALVTGLSLAISSKPWIAQADAVEFVTSFNLSFPSPNDSPFLAFNQDISVVNATNKVIRLDAISGPYDVFSYRIPSLSAPECQEGLVLAQNAICYLRIAPAL